MHALAAYLGKPEHADGENGRPDELDAGGDAPRRVVIAVLGRVVDDGREQETDGDRPLVARDDGTTDPLGRTLGLVHRDKARHHSDTETGEHTTDCDAKAIRLLGTELKIELRTDKDSKANGTGLESNTHAEDEASSNETPLATEEIAHRSS